MRQKPQEANPRDTAASRRASVGSEPACPSERGWPLLNFSARQRPERQKAGRGKLAARGGGQRRWNTADATAPAHSCSVGGLQMAQSAEPQCYRCAAGQGERVKWVRVLVV